MRILLTLVVLISVGLHIVNSRADQNPAPTSVGMSNYSTFTLATSTTAIILPRNLNRSFLFIQNNGSSAVVIKPGSTPSSATDGIVLPAGSTFMPIPPLVDALYGKSASSTDAVIMIEGAK